MSNSQEPVSEPLRRLGASLLTTARIRLELFAIEAQEEKERVAGLIVWAVFAALMAGFGVLMLTLLIIVALWDTYRLVAFMGTTVFMIAAAGFALFKVKGLLAMPATMFRSSIAELRDDAEALRRTPPQP